MQDINEDIALTDIDHNLPIKDNTEDTNVVPEVESKVEEVEVPKFKPWKDKVAEPKEESVIPYSRFKEINEERKAYASRIEELEAKQKEYDDRKKELETIKDPSEIDPNKYDSVEAYMKAYGIAVKEQAIKEVEERTIQRQEAQIQQQKAQELNNNYVKNLNEAIARNPEIKEASEYIDQYASSINPEIAYELMLDENVGELIYDISTNQELLKEMFTGNPKDFIRKMHKMSAKIDRAARYDSNDSANSTNTNIPKALEKKELPMKMRANAVGKVDIESMSMKEYRKYVANGYKK